MKIEESLIIIRAGKSNLNHPAREPGYEPPTATQGPTKPSSSLDIIIIYIIINVALSWICIIKYKEPSITTEIT